MKQIETQDRIIGFYNHLKNSESPTIRDSLQLSMQLNKDAKSSCFTSMMKIDATLGTPIDHLVDSKVLLSKKLN